VTDRRTDGRNCYIASTALAMIALPLWCAVKIELFNIGSDRVLTSERLCKGGCGIPSLLSGVGWWIKERMRPVMSSSIVDISALRVLQCFDSVLAEENGFWPVKKQMKMLYLFPKQQFCSQTVETSITSLWMFQLTF